MELVVSDVVYRKKVETNMAVGKTAIRHSSVMDIYHMYPHYLKVENIMFIYVSIYLHKQISI